MTFPFIYWFSPTRRKQARLAAARELLASATLSLDDAADLLDTVRRDAEIQGAFGGTKYARESQALRVAAAEVRGIALPDLEACQFAGKALRPAPACVCSCPCVAPVATPGAVCDQCQAGSHWTTAKQ